MASTIQPIHIEENQNGNNITTRKIRSPLIPVFPVYVTRENSRNFKSHNRGASTSSVNFLRRSIDESLSESKEILSLSPSVSFSSLDNLNKSRHWKNKILFLWYFLILLLTPALIYLVSEYENLITKYSIINEKILDEESRSDTNLQKQLLNGNGPKIVLSIIIGALCSVLAQLFNQIYKRRINITNVIKFFTWGCINGVLTSLWIDVLVLHFQDIVIRVMVDQIIGAPIFQLFFISLMTFWWDSEDAESKSSSNFKRNYFRALKLSYLIWPTFSIMSFALLPAELIFPCNCLVNLIWNIVLSFI